ncbi:SDR family NAD(P)-dependent oxidoreductase [Dongshaea marina]|uniref:SDR family NAD(P)-dependent oxidoreductase n=1 Tax=Dongshaea marina TaxID=2047966 RepID=UPI000D3ED9BC|nr:SDR family oxidoreductase [Dongshaea marina]
MSRVVVVTGAASGIGHYITSSFESRGDRVWALDRQPVEGLEKSICHSLDLGNEAEVAALFEDIGRVDVAVNCAGVPGQRSDLTEFSAGSITDEWAAIFLPTFNCMKYEILRMRGQQAGGRVINISSSTAQRGMKKFSAYSSAKASITALTRVAAIENAEFNIRVNAISPATIDTPMIRRKYGGKLRDYSDVYYTGDCGQVEDVMSAVELYLSNNFLTGHDLVLDGGLSELCQI